MKTTYHDILQSALADNTRTAYAWGWDRFTRFCAKRGYHPLPATPETVIEFLIEQATQPVSVASKCFSMGTVVLFRSAITRKHIDAGLPSPTHDSKVENTLRGLGRMSGRAIRQVKALREGHIEAMLGRCGRTPIGLRDAALIAIGFAGALRRSEICNLMVEDLDIIESSNPQTPRKIDKMFLRIRKSKTDQQGLGQKIAIPAGKRIRPISRLQAWLRYAGIDSGYVFRAMLRGGHLRDSKLHHSNIPRLLKHYAACIGLDAREISGHSLRAGFVTSAAAHHARLDKIMEITRHRNPTTVLKYIRDADSFCNHAGEGFL